MKLFCTIRCLTLSLVLVACGEKKVSQISTAERDCRNGAAFAQHNGQSVTDDDIRKCIRGTNAVFGGTPADAHAPPTTNY
jgi:hypothetical protein